VIGVAVHAGGDARPSAVRTPPSTGLTSPILAVADVFGMRSARAELVAALATTERAAAEQAGCIRYSFAATVVDPDDYLVFSQWQDWNALTAYCRSSAFAVAQSGLRGLLRRRSASTLYTITESVRPLPSVVMDPWDAD
jgi:quinol monooxygenase YgiN